MGRKRLARTLYVAMNGHLVGRWEQAANGAQTFRYEPPWLETERATPISLSLPLSPDPYTGQSVLSFFDNLLPDNRAIRERMQSSLGATSPTAFDLLTAAGADCVGALQLVENPELPDVRTVDAVPVGADRIAEILNGYRDHPLGMIPEEDDFRISMAGAQEKTAFLWDRGEWHRPRATTPTTHVFKLPAGRIESAGIDLSQSIPNEWLCLRIASALGLPVAKAEIARFRDVDALIVERFDRQWSDDRRWIIRLPQEDMCQALGVPPSKKYEGEGGPGMKKIMELLLQSQSPQQDRSTFFRACFVYWLLGAIDGHAKNFSIFLLPGGRLKLTPLYDILSAYPLTAAKQLPIQKIKMAMAVDGKKCDYRWWDIVREHWLTTAKKCDFPKAEAESILNDVTSRVDDVIDQTRDALPKYFPLTIANAIFDGMREARKRVG